MSRYSKYVLIGFLWLLSLMIISQFAIKETQRRMPEYIAMEAAFEEATASCMLTIEAVNRDCTDFNDLYQAASEWCAK